jgi:hypothetical protein
MRRRNAAAEALDDAHRPGAGLEHRERGRGGGFREFLQHDQRIEVARPGAAKLAARIEAEEAELGIALQPLARHRLAALLELRRQLRQVLASEAARRLLQHALGVGQGKVHQPRSPAPFVQAMIGMLHTERDAAQQIKRGSRSE